MRKGRTIEHARMPSFGKNVLSSNFKESNATIRVSKGCPITGEHFSIIFVTQQVTIATL